MDNLKQNTMRGEVIAQCYCIVKISGAELEYTGYTATQKWSNGNEQSDRGTRLED
jgi:hypothetical protein